jgi:hypothetical protein
VYNMLFAEERSQLLSRMPLPKAISEPRNHFHIAIYG